MKKFTVYGNGFKTLAYPRASDQDPIIDAANRAIRRVYGRSARVWGWHCESRGVIGDRIVSHNMRGTVIGSSSKTGGWPILGEAYFTI